MYNAFLNDDIISPIAHKETIKLYNERMNKAINDEKEIQEIQEEKIELFQSRQITFEQAHIRKSSNMFGFGQEVQMDACEKIWFGSVVTYLHLAVDKGTKKVLAGWFEYEELTRGYFVLLFNMILNYGIPKRIKTDKRDALMIAQCLSYGGYHAVHILTDKDEDVKIYLRMRDNHKQD